MERCSFHSRPLGLPLADSVGSVQDLDLETSSCSPDSRPVSRHPEYRHRSHRTQSIPVLPGNVAEYRTSHGMPLTILRILPIRVYLTGGDHGIKDSDLRVASRIPSQWPQFPGRHHHSRRLSPGLSSHPPTQGNSSASVGMSLAQPILGSPDDVQDADGIVAGNDRQFLHWDRH